jgi:hypothetical protein
MTCAFRLAAGVVLPLAVAAAAAAQSLGDVARKEEARRKATPKAGKVYTNETLRGERGDAPIAAPAPAAPDAAAKPAAPEKRDDPKKDEAHWRNRMAEARKSLERARMFQEALQTRINSLGNDFASRDDPAQRSVVAGSRQKALAELERVTKEIADLEKEISTIEEDARKAGVPPGWLR